MNIVFVAIGGAIGAISRYLFGLFIQKMFPQPPIPVAMVIVNIIGALGLGLFSGNFYSVSNGGHYQTPLFLILAIGFFGAFTTFSTFSVETMQLLRKRKWMNAVLYIGLTTFFSIVFLIIGFKITS